MGGLEAILRWLLETIVYIHLVEMVPLQSGEGCAGPLDGSKNGSTQFVAICTIRIEPTIHL